MRQLRFTSQGPHPYIFVAVPFGLVFLVLAFAALWLAPRDAGTVLGVLVVGSLGAAVLLSSAYGIWGTLAVERETDRCTVIRSIGRLARVQRFSTTEISTVETYDPSPGVMMWPGSAGRYLRVLLQHGRRPVSVGAGLCLGEQELTAIKELLCTPQ